MNETLVLALCLDRFVGLNIRIDWNDLFINVFETIYFFLTFYAVEELTELVNLIDAVFGWEV
jgi:hypothetical protein